MSAKLLDAVASFIARFVVFQSQAQLDASTLWTAHTHVVDASETTPRLSIRSPQRRLASRGS